MAFSNHHGMVITTPSIADQNAILAADPTLNFNKSNRSSFSPPPSSSNSSTRPVHKLPYSSSLPSSLVSDQSSRQKRRASVNGYVSRVGFDTLGCNNSSEYAFTLQSKTDGWRRTRKSRTFLVGTDLNDYSAHALRWVMDNMVEDGDEVVALRVVPLDLRDSLSKTGIPSFQGQEASARSEATKIMNSICEQNTGKKISIVVESMVGNVRETIQHMTKLYQPNMLVVGTRGRSSVKGFLLGSVSRYCLHHSTVPVVVVRPERKLNKSKTKAKGIFRRRSSIALEDNHGYQPHPERPIAYSTSDYDLRQQHQLSSSSSSSLSSTLPPSPQQSQQQLQQKLQQQQSSPAPQSLGLFPSATISVGESFPGMKNGSSRPGSGSFFSSSSPKTYASGSAPPEGILKMKKSLTADGSIGKNSLGKGFGRPSSVFASLSLGGSKKDKEKDKEDKENGGGGGSFIRKKRHSHGG